jgi:YHS domain-containing protein
MAKDPVCGMGVNEREAAEKSEYNGKVYYFCSPGCKKMFDKDPESFLKEGKNTEAFSREVPDN